jgi:hypothetical protein
MKKAIRNFWLDLGLFALLVLNVATLAGPRPDRAATAIGFGNQVHIVTGVILALACLAHIVLHWGWFRAVLSGKAPGKVKLFMNGMVSLFLLLAAVSGPAALDSLRADRFHSLFGSLALIGLFIHSVKHLRWMAAMGKKLVNGGGEKVGA